MFHLFEHNQTAYNAAVEMLDKTGKAAIIHPTGTGKSFIGLKLCSDKVDKIICWLSPSEYIFKTQLENWEEAGGIALENIKFFTYAKLAHMTDEELEDICADYIVLDEFHRCGAEIWGENVERLLSIYSNTPLLGLTATHIRYLDNQRNMADELFDGNIASEISLGEAIARGLLNPPKYVLSVYSYQKDLERYKQKIAKTKSSATRDVAQKYLDELKRALEMADDLDEIFYKHMPRKNGKYIAFCSDFQHMQKILNLAPAWFKKIDSTPHFYSAYSSNPETSYAFKTFKEDNSDHLKVLFCIDMLNEGIHVTNVDGVILFRPTVSPIVYKQQIGRAFSASSKNDAVIFDVVMNIDNLYSISSIEQEIQSAVYYYKSIGEKSLIVNERFKVIDEICNCRDLFDKLNDSLSASWDVMYLCAEKYFKQHGNLDVAKRYKTPEGYSLGAWVNTQRQVRNGHVAGILTPTQIEKLDRIGMRWDFLSDLKWDRFFAAASQYYKKNGNLKIPKSYITEDGLALGQWIANLRSSNNGYRNSRNIAAERIEQLNSIGMIWDVHDYLWENAFGEACRYFYEHTNLDVPVDYVSSSGFRLGIWITRVRGIYNGTVKGFLSADQASKLESIGMIWESKYKQRWEIMYSEAKKYYLCQGNLNVPPTYITPSGERLGRWIRGQRDFFSKGKLDRDSIERLDRLNMVWKKPDSWMVRYQIAKDYLTEHGGNHISQSVSVDGIWIGKWLADQRKQLEGKKKSSLTAEKEKLLGALLSYENE